MPTSPVIDEMASMKEDVKRAVEDAVAAVILLAWPYISEDFSWDAYPDLDSKVNKIMSGLSDEVRMQIRRKAKKALAEEGMEELYDDAIAFAEKEIDGQTMLYRLDMHATHLKDVLAGWLAVAAVSSLTQVETRVNLMAHLPNPALSPLWRKAGLPVLKWGRGYIRSAVDGMTLIGQDAINRSYQWSVVERFKKDDGIIGYRTVRNSSFDCPYCDELGKEVWPLDVVVLPYHARCVCSAVPVRRSDMDELEESL